MEITKKQILKTVLLPEIYPRIKTVLGSSFGNLAFLIAQVYSTVRILPANHPYLKPNMIGQYGVRQVIAQAANHICVSRKNIDQIIIFFSVIAALILMAMQFIVLALAFIIPKANAQATMPSTISDFFKTPSPENDLAYKLLDLVFGIPNFFSGKADVTQPIHTALHAMFEFYSIGMIFVGVIIIIYFVFAIVAETVQSGTPFGQRFNHSWAAVRLILFFGLLIPLTHGINAGQYITLASAKLGSSLASTGWVIFNDMVFENGQTLTGDKEHNVAKPKPSSLMHVPSFMMVAKTCQHAYRYTMNKENYPQSWQAGVKAWAVYKPLTKTNSAQNGESGSSCGASDGYAAEELGDKQFTEIVEKSGPGEIFITFGVCDVEEHSSHKASIMPVCGSIVMKAVDKSQPGSAVIQNGYLDLIRDMWKGEINELSEYSENYVKRYTSVGSDFTAELPDHNYKRKWSKYLDEYMDENNGLISRAVRAQIDKGHWEMPQEMKNYGWAGAGIWYNKVAEQNGALISAIRQTPVGLLYPDVMERIKAAKEKEDKKPSTEDKTSLVNSPETKKILVRPGEDEIAGALNKARLFWEKNPFRPQKKLTGNGFVDTINAVLGTQGLFDMCDNTDTHPLAQLSAVGKSMLDSSIVAFTASMGFGFLSIFAEQFGATTSAISGMFGTVASIGFLVGLVLFYVLPFMPFIYFFFAVTGWVKGIFEAMVAMPLWALAHLRIDGDGIPGEAAIGGYFLIFEIFIRPILIVFGLLAAITLFAAMVKVLNEVFYLVIANVAGHDPESSTSCFQNPGGENSDNVTEAGTPTEEATNMKAEMRRGPIDEFFFTILYTIIVYMIGMGCFKLIDMIPNNILRWINAELPSFNDERGDPAANLMQYVTLGGSELGGNLGKSLGQVGTGMKETVMKFTSSGR